MQFRTLAIAAALAASGAAHAVSFTPNFSEYSFPGSQFDVDAAANTFYHDNYGLTVSNAYLYRDSRDTFDGIGIANGTVSEIGTPQTGRVDFVDVTNFVTLDYLAIFGTVYSAYSSGGTLLSTQTVTPGTGTLTLDSLGSQYISYVTFSSTGGFGTISSLTYNFDGNPDGGNTDLPSSVPEPASVALMLAGLGAVALRRRPRRDA